MKTNKTKLIAKYTLKAISISTQLLIGTGAFAQAPSDVPQEINAQMGVTHDEIEHILEKLNSSTLPPGTDAGDYVRSSGAFRDKVAKAVETFENSLKNDILPKAAPFISRYDALYNTPTYGAVQKEILLKQQYELLQSLMKDLSAQYQASLKELYNTFDLPYTYTTSGKEYGYDCLGRYKDENGQEMCGGGFIWEKCHTAMLRQA